MTPYDIAEKYTYFAQTYCPDLERHILYPEVEGSKFIYKADNYLKYKQHHTLKDSKLHTAIRPLKFMLDIVSCSMY